VAVDLTYGRAAVETEMVDVCAITRDTEGEEDDVFDRDTGQYTPPVGDVTTVYDEDSLGAAGRALNGMCLVTPETTQPQPGDAGGDPVSSTRYRALLPWDAPLPAVGDTFTLTGSLRDEHLVGQDFTVDEVEVSTVLTDRRLRLTKVDRAVHRR
jgi:hypothetical protein